MPTREAGQQFWTTEEDAVIKQYMHLPKAPVRDMLAQLPGRTLWSVKARLYNLREVARAEGNMPSHSGTRPMSVGTRSRRRASPEKNENPGVRKCLSCDRDFKSWDVVRNRLCPSCGGGNQLTLHSLPRLRL